MTTRRKLIKAAAGLAACPPIASAVHKPASGIDFSEFRLRDFVFQKPGPLDYGDGPIEGYYAIGAIFISTTSKYKRLSQAVRFPEGATPAQLGKALEELGRFLQQPDERVRFAGQELAGHELNAP